MRRKKGESVSEWEGIWEKDTYPLDPAIELTASCPLQPARWHWPCSFLDVSTSSHPPGPCEGQRLTVSRGSSKTGVRRSGNGVRRSGNEARKGLRTKLVTEFEHKNSFILALFPGLLTVQFWSALCAPVLCFEPGVMRFSLSECLKLQHLGQQLYEKYLKHVLSIRDPLST